MQYAEITYFSSVMLMPLSNSFSTDADSRGEFMLTLLDSSSKIVFAAADVDGNVPFLWEIDVDAWVFQFSRFQILLTILVGDPHVRKVIY